MSGDSLTDASLFVVAAIVLLGSPGPGIAALVAVGKTRGVAGGLRYYWGLQAGLALAAGLSAAGLFSVAQAWPAAITVMLVVAVVYLVWLSLQIAIAPVDGSPAKGASPSIAATAAGGFLLGISNPKSYLAFVALMAAHPIAEDWRSDALLKWLLCVLVMVVVDLAWLWLGVVAGRTSLAPRTERALNVLMGATILITTILPIAQI